MSTAENRSQIEVASQRATYERDSVIHYTWRRISTRPVKKKTTKTSSRRNHQCSSPLYDPGDALLHRNQTLAAVNIRSRHRGASTRLPRHIRRGSDLESSRKRSKPVHPITSSPDPLGLSYDRFKQSASPAFFLELFLSSADEPTSSIDPLQQEEGRGPRVTPRRQMSERTDTPSSSADPLQEDSHAFFSES